MNPPAVESKRPSKFKRALGAFFLPRLLGSPLHRPASKGLIVLRFTGRKSGRRFTQPVGRHEIDGQLYVLSGQRWSVNFIGGREVEVTLDGRRVPATGTLIKDPDAVAEAFHRRIEEYGYRKAEGKLGLRINVERTPTLDELREAAARIPLTLVRIDRTD